MKILLASSDATFSASLTESLLKLGLPAPGRVSDSNAAVDWINSHSGCDLLITEVYLAPMDGFALRDFLVEHLPDLKIAFTSAYDISPYAERLEGAPFLPQPCDTAFLRTVLGTLIPLPEAHQSPVAALSPKPVAWTTMAVAKASAAAPEAAQPVAKTPAPTPQPAAPIDPRVGTTLGNYLVEARIGATPTETLYRAKQTTVGRPVLLRVLNNPESGDPAMARRFMEDARAKAKVSHSLVTAVYEGGEQDGTAFCSGEFVAAPNLAILAAQNKKIDGPTALKIVKSCADVLGAFEQQAIAHHPLQAASILLPPGSAPRLANPACHDSGVTPAAAAEMASIASFLLPLLDLTPASAPARGLLTRLQSGESFAWPALAEAAEGLLPKAVPDDASKIQAQDITRQKAAAEARAKSRRNLVLSTGVSLVLTATACYFVFKAFSPKGETSIRDLGTMIEIPAGEFSYQDGKATLPTFYISKYEISISEYAAFLEDLKKHPEKAAAIAHPDQPPGKSHVPVGWADMTEIQPPNPGYYKRAATWGQYQGVPLTLDGPVFGVDWFDAYAYAKWKGQRLPTEQEWEKAARGPSSSRHPWGNENDPKLANTGSDFTPNPDPKVGGKIDGFKRWSPVNEPKTDRSGYGPLNMAGNVSEWTSSWDGDAQGGGEKVPVFRGGNWKTVDEATVTRRGTKLTELQSDDGLGFRTASDSPAVKP